MPHPRLYWSVVRRLLSCGDERRLAYIFIARPQIILRRASERKGGDRGWLSDRGAAASAHADWRLPTGFGAGRWTGADATNVRVGRRASTSVPAVEEVIARVPPARLTRSFIPASP